MVIGPRANRDRAGEGSTIRRVTLAGMAVNILLAGLKFVLGVVGHSQALVADAAHSLSDLGTDLALLLGVKYWTAPADDDHAYGHHRIETLVSAAIGGAEATEIIEGNREAHKFTLTNALKDMRYLEAMADGVNLANPIGNAVKNSFALAHAAGGDGPEDYVPHLTDYVLKRNGVEKA